MSFRDHATALQARVAALERQLEEKEREIEALAARGLEAEADGAAVTAPSTADSFASRVLRSNRRLKEELEESEQRIRGLEAQIEDMTNSDEAALARTLGVAKRQAEEDQEALIRKGRANDKLVAIVEELRAAMAEAERGHAEAVSEAESLRGEVERLRGTLRGSELRAAELEERLAQIRETWTRLNALVG